MADNPFYVSPPDIFQALQAGVQGFDKSRKVIQDNAKKAGEQSALQKLMAGDTRGAFADAVGTGNHDLAKVISTQDENVWSRRFKESEAARSGEQFNKSLELQRGSQAIQRAALQATLDGQKVPPGYRRTPDGNLQGIPGGPADPTRKPEDPFDNETKLRKELEGIAKPYQEVRNGYRRIQASKDDAAGDISLIFGYMKMLDPGSVVREGEFATAQNAGGVPERIANLYNKALDGTRLTTGQRAMFKGQAGAIFKQAESEYKTRENQYRGLATSYKMDPSRIIPAFDDINAPMEAPAIPPPPAGFSVVK